MAIADPHLTSIVPRVRRRAQRIAKRSIDIVVSASLLILSAPALLFIALAVKLDSKGPAVFKQIRVGANSRLFVMYKFRTMTVGTPEVPTNELRDLPSSITRVGGRLRTMSLDELPQLYNVLRGDMSLVGPRPVLPNHSELLKLRKEYQLEEMIPGITGWAQVNGRDTICDKQKAALERQYRDTQSTYLDIKIIIKTFGVVFSGRGAN